MPEQAVIVGVGERIDRPDNVLAALEPVDLMAAALTAAQADSGAKVLAHIDSLDLVGLISWRYRDPVALLADRLGIAPAHQRNASMGGETPIRLIHEAALAIQRGEIRAAAIVGGEAVSSRNRARKEGAALPWTPMAAPEDAVRFPGSSYETSRPARRLRMLDPANIYPFYEVASQAEWGQTPQQAQMKSAALWQRFAQVASENPSAWIHTAPDAATIAEATPDNRMISWPYPKLMVANPSVNQAAAVIVMSLSLARELGVPEDRIIHIHGGAAAAEPEDYLARDSYAHSTAQQAVLNAASQIAGGADKFGRIELYSCFPVVPKMALRTLGLDETSTVPTVTGGLTFFGGPLNNYMGHAAAAMVRTLRAHPGELGLLYGQGGYVTKHHALVLGTTKAPDMLAENYSVQSAADAARDPVPALAEDYSGAATIETYTVPYARDGEPLQGVVIARTPDGRRVMARVTDDDPETLARLIAFDRNAVGEPGWVRLDAFGYLAFAIGAEPKTRARHTTLVERDGHLTVVTINRPAAMNSLDPRTNAELAEIFDEFAADPDQWVAIITGAGDRAFCAGNDLKETARRVRRGMPIDMPTTGFGGLTARFDCDKPVITAVNGLAMGGGFEIALAADIVVAADTAIFALPEPKVGLAAVAGGLLRLSQQIPRKQAMDIILTGRNVPAQEGKALGFVNEIVPADQVMDAARRWAGLMMEASPMALRASKQVVRKGADEPSLAEAYRQQGRYPGIQALARSADFREGPAAFAQKRKPQWKGR